MELWFVTKYYNAKSLVQFVETEMGNKIDPKIINLSGGFVPMEMVVKGKSINFFVLSFSLAKKWLGIVEH